MPTVASPRRPEKSGRSTAHFSTGNVSADDVKPGKVTSFPQSVQLKDDETVVFSWILYNSREDRDRINAKVMEDPRMKDMMDPKAMPFDGMRMFWGGFKSIVEL